AEDGIRDFHVTGVQTCALPIYSWGLGPHTAKSFPLASCTIIFGIDLVPLVRYFSIRKGSLSRNSYETEISSFSLAISSINGTICEASPHQGSVITIQF